MPFYEYECSTGRFTILRPIAERNAPALCAAGSAASRVFSVPAIHWGPGVHPVTGTSWHDLYDESPRELAHKPGVERYDPNMDHKPALRSTPLHDYLPDRGESSGSAERLRLSPIPGDPQL